MRAGCCQAKQSPLRLLGRGSICEATKGAPHADRAVAAHPLDLGLAARERVQPGVAVLTDVVRDNYLGHVGQDS